MTDIAPSNENNTHCTARSKAAASAVAALGLVSTWSAPEAQADTVPAEISILSTITILNTNLTNAVTFFSDTATVTITTAAVRTPDVSGGTIEGIAVGQAATITPTSSYSFAATLANTQGSSDLVLAFSGDGSVADGVAWTSLFVDNIPLDQRAFEPEIIKQLANPFGIEQDGSVEPGSQIDRLNVYYSDLLSSRFGEAATLVVFDGPGNTGRILGSITVVPTPAGAGLVAVSGVFVAARRRRGCRGCRG